MVRIKMKGIRVSVVILSSNIPSTWSSGRERPMKSIALLTLMERTIP